MSYKYSKSIRIPSEVYEGFKQKKLNMESMIEKELKVSKKLHFSDALRFFSQKKVMVYPDELAEYLNKRKRKKRVFPVSI